ncbi:MAG: hypothetical protein OEZ39_16510 [Gammaproteobacteria bacterium]|nr:hypothetical protein [Gammaproteobacteria bacterium]MDH5653463.1 hypothetical protein [Gammaproteobacteria bacterium]
MKTMLTMLGCLFSFSLYAADPMGMPPGMPQGNMQEMMQQMQQLQACMASVPPEKLQELHTRSQAFNDKVKSLCRQGARKKAQQAAMDFGKKLEKDPIIKQVKKCGTMAMSMMPQLTSMAERGKNIKNICDAPDMK